MAVSPFIFTYLGRNSPNPKGRRGKEGKRNYGQQTKIK